MHIVFYTKNMLLLLSHPGAAGDTHALVYKLVRALSALVALGLRWVARKIAPTYVNAFDIDLRPIPGIRQQPHILGHIQDFVHIHP